MNKVLIILTALILTGYWNTAQAKGDKRSPSSEIAKQKLQHPRSACLQYLGRVELCDSCPTADRNETGDCYKNKDLYSCSQKRLQLLEAKCITDFILWQSSRAARY